jgi:glycosyltransferase involved in cell wall biosynthesis
LRVHLHVSELWRGIVEAASWCIALAWGVKAAAAVKNMPTLPNLSGYDWDLGPTSKLTLTVVVPARDEAENIVATLEALLLADYPLLKILAVDDRSTDATGSLMEEFAARFPERISVVHITELPEGWLGKTHALATALEQSASDYVLFTDADVLFSPSILRRAMAYAESSQADHLVVLPTMQVKSRGEGILLGFLQIFGLWASRPWMVEDPEARHDVAGVGAFNMVRREAMEEIGGWSPQRMAILEDITLGRRMKAARMRQRIAFAPGLILVHWAKGMRGLMRVMTKNLFSVFNFRSLLVLGACVWVMIFCLLPLAGLFWVRTLIPAVLTLCCIGATYRLIGAVSQIDARYAWLYPLGAVSFMFAMVRSMVIVWWQRGVVWRGTHYGLRELRRHNSPFVWEREAKKLREQERRDAKLARRAG